MLSTIKLGTISVIIALSTYHSYAGEAGSEESKSGQGTSPSPSNVVININQPPNPEEAKKEEPKKEEKKEEPKKEEPKVTPPPGPASFSINMINLTNDTFFIEGIVEAPELKHYRMAVQATVLPGANGSVAVLNAPPGTQFTTADLRAYWRSEGLNKLMPLDCTGIDKEKVPKEKVYFAFVKGDVIPQCIFILDKI